MRSPLIKKPKARRSKGNRGTITLSLSFNSLLLIFLRDKRSDSVRKASNLQKAEKALVEARSDFERKLKVLTHCLEEKAEDNVILAEQNKELHQKYVLMDQMYKVHIFNSFFSFAFFFP